jgi:hypothetical protein
MTFRTKIYFSGAGILFGILLGIYLVYRFPVLSIPVKPIAPVQKYSAPEIKLIPKPLLMYKDTGSYHCRDTGSIQWCYFPIDSQAIIQEYFYSNVYYRILKDDSCAFISLSDTVTRNLLSASKLVFINRQSQLKSPLDEPPSMRKTTEFSGGLLIGRISKQFGIGPSLSLSRIRNSYTIGYDVVNKDFYFTYSKSLWHN